ncbi:uncharacterized protein LOC126844069 [Adelges cooleyi]|uniref:uncharacterized protein LOC126833647 n=1 Tax=Adelges cooleyi TaxID=133065 RepID=UPI00217F8789|nr:uncharacterized protein LOC126833647 [Adelges cooleyi]XP_050437881.1 uncharacterized protein LOC126844069 [Adelges cooleyi]
MAKINYYFILLSICVACTFEIDTSILKKDYIIIYQQDFETGVCKFVKEDGKNPLDEKLDLAFYLKPQEPCYVYISNNITKMGITGENVYNYKYTFEAAELIFGTLFRQGGIPPSK